MKIQEVMNKYPVTVGKDAPISDVADLLVKYNLTAVSVVDDDNKLLGIISEGDLLYKKVRPHVPHYVNVLGALASITMASVNTMLNLKNYWHLTFMS